ncbi:Ferritin [Trichuris trichiura]|uniref:Ferritin n=1 Tax=Trichuris trichiura TaxID=36087 RepID=A0A077Z9L3_TRITR|nr:Ferritin [Trichuris trichiura]
MNRRQTAFNPKRTMTTIAQNFHTESEVGLNKQINIELYASNLYLSMAAYFDRHDVALPGFAVFFRRQSDEERQHAMKLIKYQNLRGGRVKLQNIDKPSSDDWGSGLEAMKAALALEKSVNQGLLELHAIAERHNDCNMCDFLADEFLKEQVEAINRLSQHVTNLSRLGPGMGEYLFDKMTLSGNSS